jgi:hypothetical protein
MRYLMVAGLALVFAAIAIGDSASWAMDVGSAAMGPARLAALSASVEEAHWTRRCNRHGCWRVWIGGYFGPPSVRDSCVLWRATHWGLRRAWVC